MIESNHIYNEDCLVTMKHFEGSSIDMILTSPPYDDVRDYHKYTFEFEPIAHQLYRILKSGRVCVWVVGDATKNFCETLTPFKQAIYFVNNTGFNLLDTMIYEKNGGHCAHPNLKRYPQWFEYMFILCKGKPTVFNPIKDKTNKYSGKNNTGNTQRQRDGSTKPTGSYIVQEYSSRHNVWKYDVGYNKDTKDKIATAHPARFPEKLAADHILSWSNENDLVYDPFMGSGTTAKAALLLKRRFIGSEISEEYCKIANDRIKPYL